MALGTSAGDVYVDGHFRLASGFGREMTLTLQGPAARAGEEASRHFGRRFAAGLAISGAVIGAGIVKGTRLAVRGISATTKAASDLNETVNKSRVIFGPAFAAVDKFARGSARSLGLSRQEALANAASFGDMFKQIGFGIRPAANMSKGMVRLSADLASFHNADITQVLEAQQAAFRGEYDSLQRFVPAINAARVQQVAMAQTGKTNARELTAQEKALATYTIMLRDTKDAQGDFSRTARDNANQQRIMRAQWIDLKAALGQGFLPAQLAVTRAFTDKLLPAGMIFVRELAPGISATATAVATSLANAVPPAGELADTARHLSERLSELGPELGTKVGAGLGKLFDLLERLGPELRNANVQTSDLAPTLRLSGALFGFVADHADELARHIPLLVAGFAAYKATQAAANSAALLSLPIRAAEVAANLALSASNRALVASLGGRTAATVTVTAAERAATTTTVAWGTATTATAGSLRTLTLGLGLFGAALAVGEVVDRLTERLGRFQKVTEFALGGVGLFGVAVGGLKDAWGAMTGAQDRAVTSTQSAITAADRHAAAVRGEKAAIDGLKDALDNEKTSELDVRQAKLNVSTAQARLTQLTKEGKKGSFEYKQAQLDLERAQIDLRHKTDDYKAAQQKSNLVASDARQAASNAARAHREYAAAAGRAGGAGKLFGQRVRDGILVIPKGRVITIKATFGFNTPPGISMHDIVGATGGYVTPRAIVPRRLHRGGMLDGPGTETSDSIPARLSKGEYVVRAKAVRAVGRDTMDWINAQGFAAGGGVDLDAQFPSTRRLANMIGQFEGVIDRGMRRLADRFDRMAGARPPHAPGGWKVALRFLSALGIPYTNISDFRPGAVTHASGRQSYHALNRAVDLDGPDKLRIWSALTRTDPTELIYSRAPRYKSRRGWRPIGALDPITRADHYSHVHAAYDKGGWLMPGTTVAHNATGRPERVLAPGEGAVNLTVNIHNHGPIIGSPQEFAREVTPQIRRHLKDQLRREGKIALANQL